MPKIREPGSALQLACDCQSEVWTALGKKNWGGMFLKRGSPTRCVSPNPYTGACSCPEGFVTNVGHVSMPPFVSSPNGELVVENNCITPPTSTFTRNYGGCVFNTDPYGNRTDNDICGCNIGQREVLIFSHEPYFQPYFRYGCYDVLP